MYLGYNDIASYKFLYNFPGCGLFWEFSCLLVLEKARRLIIYIFYFYYFQTWKMKIVTDIHLARKASPYFSTSAVNRRLVEWYMAIFTDKRFWASKKDLKWVEIYKIYIKKRRWRLAGIWYPKFHDLKDLEIQKKKSFVRLNITDGEYSDIESLKEVTSIIRCLCAFSKREVQM